MVVVKTSQRGGARQLGDHESSRTSPTLTAWAKDTAGRRSMRWFPKVFRPAVAVLPRLESGRSEGA